MGNSQTQSSEDNFLSEYEQVRKENGGMVITHKQNQANYFLREFSYADKKEFQTQLNKFKNLQTQEPNQSLLNVLKVCSKEFTNFCSNTYKIYTVYQYPSVTLQEEINARKKQHKYFQECELWAILQSCVNALSEVKPIIALHPTLVFIVPDGLLKVINNDMITEDHRCVINESVYYAPEKINNFHKADHENSLKKEAIFSLGMTILNAALLESVNNCYDYQKYEFIQSTLEQNIQKLVGKYSEQFIQILAMILEPNQSKRSSLVEVKDLLSQVWNSTEEQEVQTSKQNSKMLEKSAKRMEDVQQSRNNGSQFLRQTYVDSQKFTAFNSERESRPILNEKSSNIPQPPINKDNLFTDPKLLQMIRKDLETINEQRKVHSSQITSVNASIKPSNPQFNYPPQQPVSSHTSENELSQINQLSENVVTEEDGIRYEGYMLNGKRYGYGKLFYPDGAYYEGQFREGLLWGKGTLFYGPEKPAYEGDWVEDHFEGFGKLYNDNVKNLLGGFNFEDFDNVEDFWLFYQGEFKNDYKEGKGKFVLSNGEYFEGQFRNDSINGRGVFKTADNQKVEGIWENNVLVHLIQ